MQHPAPAIPDKLFFKIGEVCDLVGVQAHVLRYWETEFPMLQPQKNRSGQRTYRRKDVEMALRIRQLLYEEGFTIAGAKKKLASEGKPTRLKIVPPGATAGDFLEPGEATPAQMQLPGPAPLSRLSRDKIRLIRSLAEDLLTTLDRDVTK
ncbi:MAG: MerR family transcriptional regulator [Acidobacteriota bacterium]|nr:MAG: MerR family transcriptional regulator [Acidobacteriota bacterium]